MLTRVGIFCVVKGVMLVEVKIVQWIGCNTTNGGSARAIDRGTKGRKK
jgi:hypothetical protein